MMNGAGSVSYREQTRSAGCIPVMELLGDDEPQIRDVVHVFGGDAHPYRDYLDAMQRAQERQQSEWQSCTVGEFDDRPLYKPLGDAYASVLSLGVSIADMPPLKLATCKCRKPVPARDAQSMCMICDQLIAAKDEESSKHGYTNTKPHCHACDRPELCAISTTRPCDMSRARKLYDEINDHLRREPLTPARPTVTFYKRGGTAVLVKVYCDSIEDADKLCALVNEGRT